jgi:histidyl-tRNA synthetase
MPVVERIQAIRGMNDVLPETSFSWRTLEEQFADVLTQYGYQQIRFPILESTSLFKRTIGEVTDVVEKEMYTFTDRNGDSLTLRPEGTAGCLRACLEHGLLHNQQQKLWYYGPMFRHEKPQKGRYRQFHQFGVEAFGIPGVAIELELLALCKRFWTGLGVINDVRLEINTIGTSAERQVYRQTLIDYFTQYIDILDDDSKHRLHRSPLRILDSKNEQMQAIIANAPRLIDVLGDDSKQRFTHLCNGLTQMGIAYSVNPYLVRGLDYYEHLVFEWVTDKLGAQGTICAGGRFDKLVEHLGGNPSSAIGFAMGAERLLLLMETLALQTKTSPLPAVFILAANDAALPRALMLAESLRDAHSGIVVVNTAGGSFKSQFKKADKSGARFAVIIGDDELRDNTVTVKDLRGQEGQQTIGQDQLNQYIYDKL